VEAQVVNTRAAAAFTGLAVATLNNMRVAGGGPRYLKLGRAVRYRIADLDAWLSERVVASTSDLG
jgi:predicted DNA-binding transcriptional regulator AlpA